jgi:hypothetical protein
MTSTLHAHVETASADCDGRYSGSYTVVLNDDEIAESQKPVNDFHDITFRERVLCQVVSAYATYGGTLTVKGDDKGVSTSFEWNEGTEEGFRHAHATFCEREHCNTTDAR